MLGLGLGLEAMALALALTCVALLTSLCIWAVVIARWSIIQGYIGQCQGSQTQETPFGGMNRRFKPNAQNGENFILSKLLNRFQSNSARR